MGAGRLPICLWGLLPPGAVQKEHVPQTCSLLEPHETQWPTQKKQVAKESKRVLRVLSICRGSHANPSVYTKRDDHRLLPWKQDASDAAFAAKCMFFGCDAEFAGGCGAALTSPYIPAAASNRGPLPWGPGDHETGQGSEYRKQESLT